MPRQNSTIQMSIGTVRAKNPAVLQATAEVSTSIMPIASLRSEGALEKWALAPPLRHTFHKRQFSPVIPGLDPGVPHLPHPHLDAPTEARGDDWLRAPSPQLPQRPIQGCQQPIDILIVIVVREADAHYPVFRGQPQRLDQTRGPVVAVADGDAVLVELGDDIGGFPAGNMERDHRGEAAIAGGSPTDDAHVPRLRGTSSIFSASRASCAAIRR